MRVPGPKMRRAGLLDMGLDLRNDGKVRPLSVVRLHRQGRFGNIDDLHGSRFLEKLW